MNAFVDSIFSTSNKDNKEESDDNWSPSTTSNVPKKKEPRYDNIKIAEEANRQPHWSDNINKEFETLHNKDLSLNDFTKSYNNTGHVEGIDFDATKATHFGLINTAPTLRFFDHRRTVKDFSINKNEVDVLKKNGFVVSERTGSKSFADTYLMLYNAHLPVFITLDSVLHAWHESFDTLLERTENDSLHSHLKSILEVMINELNVYKQSYENFNPDLQTSILDVDVFLTVAKNLLEVEDHQEHDASSPFDDLYNKSKKPVVIKKKQEQYKVTEIMNAIKSGGFLNINLFGRDSIQDFSQFKPRGHYEKTKALRCYFQSMMWLGRILFEVAKYESELGASLLMLHLINKSNALSKWQSFDRLLQLLIGRTDSLNFNTLLQLVRVSNIDLNMMFDIKTPSYSSTLLKQIQDDLKKSNLGRQLINSIVLFVGPEGNRPDELERAFAFMGQRSTIDGWATEKVVFNNKDLDKTRRLMSGLDISFSVFNNKNTVELLSDRMKRTGDSKIQFRDGVEYHSNLEATHQAVNKIMNQECFVNESIYMMWLNVFRSMHEAENELLLNKNIPQVFKTKAWAMKDVETELASWSQLRHDTVLYVKQPYFGLCGCDYPDAYVDPRSAAWKAIYKMANALADGLDDFYNITTVHDKVDNSKLDRDTERRSGKKSFFISDYNNKKEHHNAIHFRNFAYVASKLAGISEKQLRDEPHSEEDVIFLKSTAHNWGYMSGMPWGASGWYNHLFLKSQQHSKNWNPVVADVYTVPPDPRFNDRTGGVLTEAVGNINTLYMALDFNNGKKIMFVGPVFSHYEFYQSTRMSDSEWRQSINQSKMPSHPEWTENYLVPGVNPESPGYVYED
ncbi:hypothetical protein AKO1_007028 [Acrasis kona]|uniref:DUF3160 domain-containing protein n=1 Tax=Acrasis kona TaxID=1008807 RepID=A0AAW2YUC0_9EUKA